MATIIDYPSLQSQIALYLNRQDLTSQIPVFIQLAEAKFNRELRVPQMQAISTGNASSATIPLPADFVAMYKFNMVINSNWGWGWNWCNYSNIAFISDQDADNLINSNTWASYNTNFYTIYGTNIQLVNAGPFNTTIPYTIKYYQQIPSLAANNTNWLITSSPDLYLYSALLEASTYLTEQDAEIQLWGQARTGLMAALQQQADESRFPQSGLRAVWKSF